MPPHAKEHYGASHRKGLPSIAAPPPNHDRGSHEKYQQ